MSKPYRCNCGRWIDSNYLTNHFIDNPTHREETNMYELIIYTDRCLTCQDSDRLGKVQKFAKKYNLKFTVKQTHVFPELKKEAEIFGAKMPFILLNNKTTNFYSITPNVLEDDVEQKIT